MSRKKSILSHLISMGVLVTLGIVSESSHADPKGTQARTRSASTQGGASSVAGTSSSSATAISGEKRMSRLGMNYFSFVSGPGIDPDNRDYPPNVLGRPAFTGMNAFNVVSVRYKMNPALALDFQTRTRFVFNNGTGGQNFNRLIWEAPRIGVSGKLASGQDWSLTGAVNTDFPSFLPSPLTGYTARERTVLFNPGMFANFRYAPKRSKWSLFAILSPRYFFYRDREALEPEAVQAGASGLNKTELGLWVSPTLNYAFTEKSALTFGSSLGYLKQVGSGWNPARATAVGNATGEAWVLEAVPVSVGWTYTFNESLTVYPFLQGFPIAGQRVDATTGRAAGFLETASLGMWVSGSLF